MSSLRSCIGGLLIASVLLGAEARGHDAAPPPLCKSPLLTRDSRYDVLACEGLELMEKKAYAEAAKRFERALAIGLFEQPNYKLLPLLALAHHRAGDKAKALAALESAELALNVLTGIGKCVDEGDDKFVLYEEGMPVRSPQAAATVDRMCGAILEDYYMPSSLRRFVAFADRVREFLEVSDEIHPPEPDDSE